jgi:hypothetical protein
MTEHENENPTAWTPPNIPEETVVVSHGPKRRPAAYLAVLIGLVAMAGGAVFFAKSLGSAEGGADTPVAAVQRLFDALGDEDALGMLETLLPSERDALIDPIKDVTRELGRLGILSENLDLGAIPGIELEFSGLKFSAEQIGPGVSVVGLDAGTVNYTVDPAKSPLGDFVRRFMSDEDNKVVRGSDTIAEGSGDDGTIATVERDGKWYVSLWYTVAEGARTSAGAPVPAFGNGIAARGAGSPEAAVEAFIRSAVLLDVRRLVELTPPEEMRALHDYAPLFIDAAEAGAREARKHYSAEVSVLKLAGSQTGDRALVKVDELEFEFAVPELGISAEYDGQCATIRGDFFGQDPMRQCGNGLGGVPIPGLPTLETPEIGFVAVREDGAWYVSPTRTLLEGIVATLKVLDRKDLDMFVQIFGGMSGG